MLLNFLVILDTVRDNVQYTLSQTHLCPHKHNKFRAIVRMRPHTVLHFIKSGFSQKDAQLVARPPPPFPYVKDDDAPPGRPTGPPFFLFSPPTRRSHMSKMTMRHRPSQRAGFLIRIRSIASKVSPCALPLSLKRIFQPEESFSNRTKIGRAHV